MPAAPSSLTMPATDSDDTLQKSTGQPKSRSDVGGDGDAGVLYRAPPGSVNAGNNMPQPPKPDEPEKPANNKMN